MARIPSQTQKSVRTRVGKPGAAAAAAAADPVVEPASPTAVRKTPSAKKKPANAPKAKAAPAKKAKPVPAATAKAPSAAAEPAPAKPAKAAKPRLVRDSFTIPKQEYAVLAALKSRALGLEQHVRKSELLRAGIQVLNAMGDRAFLKAIDAVPTLKTGRPKKG